MSPDKITTDFVSNHRFHRFHRLQCIACIASFHSDCTISPHCDSLIAKIIVHGRDHQEAIGRMRRTPDMMVVEGIKTSVPLHLNIQNEPDFQAGRVDTSFIERFISKPELHQLAEIA